MNEEARLARNAYMREYKRKNKERIMKKEEEYWIRKSRESKALDVSKEKQEV